MLLVAEIFGYSGCLLLMLYPVGADAPNVPVEAKVIAAPYCLLTAAAICFVFICCVMLIV